MIYMSSRSGTRSRGTDRQLLTVHESALRRQACTDLHRVRTVVERKLPVGNGIYSISLWRGPALTYYN